MFHQLVEALGSEPTSLDPHTVDDGGERAINDNIYETLLSRDAEGALAPGLASEMPTQIDATTWQFKLRSGVTFHDGTPFNADAVVATVSRIQRLITEKKTDNDGFFSSLTGATKVDDLTVNITTAKQDGVLRNHKRHADGTPRDTVAPRPVLTEGVAPPLPHR